MDPEGETTWALVVGIDKYDDDEIPVLTGAVADAVAATRWLQRLGVPQSQILLHAAPSEKSAGRLAAVQCWKPCRAGDIWESLGMLRGKKGSRLFVFLFGHGLLKRPSGRKTFPRSGFRKAWVQQSEYRMALQISALTRIFATIPDYGWLLERVGADVPLQRGPCREASRQA